MIPFIKMGKRLRGCRVLLLCLILLEAWGSAEAQTCSSDANCSFNGICSEGTCKCDPGWQGEYCHQLILAPGKNISGLDLLHSKNISTWGGSVLYSETDGKYHMWNSLITKNCGIHQWLGNSIITHAVSSGPPDWTFELKEEVFPVFSHEPIVARAPTGEFVIFFTQFLGGASGEHCVCTDGNSYSGGSDCVHEPGPAPNATLFSYFSWSKSPYGPWTKPESLAHCQPSNHTDQNLSPVILEDGSLLAWSRWSIWNSSDWRNPKLYQNTGEAPDFAHGGMWEGEDPSMWRDKRGHFHILSHNGPRGEPGEKGDCGRHFYSATGKANTWLPAPLPKEDLGGCAYPRVDVPWDDGTPEGTNYTFYRRERPHLIFGPDGYTPVALATAAIDSPSLDAQTPQRDASYTIIQRVITTTQED